MRVESSALLSGEVEGSGNADRLEVNIWRGADLLREKVDVESFSIRWRDGQQVQGQGTFTLADSDGTLAPWAIDDAAAPGGSELQLTLVTGASGLEVPLGRWRIRSANPNEGWVATRDAAGETLLVPSGGGTVTLDADELTSVAVMSRLDAERVPAGATCLGEIARLMLDVCPVEVDALVADANVPTTLVYEEGRMDAVEDHVERVGARWRMGPAGALEVVPRGPLDPVATLEPGEGGVIVSVERTFSDEGLYNAVVATSQEAGDGQRFTGRAYIDDGPLAYGGPFGKVPLFHQSIATSQSGVNASAQTLLTNREVDEVELTVSCLLNPALQINDWVTVVPPTTAGTTELVGRVTGMSMAGSSGVVSRLSSLNVAVSTPDLAAVARKVRGG